MVHQSFNTWKSQLGLFQDPDGLWRCEGRLHHARIPYITKFPVLLPSNHYLTRLFVLKAHTRVFHNGVKEMLTELRSHFWIIKGRALTSSPLYHRFEALAYKAQPPLPPFRVTEESPFTFTGVDLLAHCSLKELDCTVHMLCDSSHSPRPCAESVNPVFPHVFQVLYCSSRNTTKDDF